MKLEKGIVIHATNEAKKKYKEKKSTRKSSCPSCQIETIKKFVMKNDEVDVDDESEKFEIRDGDIIIDD
jgi:hypothetical protein